MAQYRLGQRKVFGISDLEVFCAARHQSGRQAKRFNGARLVGDRCSPAFSRVQRAHQQADAKHLRRLRQPFVVARQRVAHAAVDRLLERVGQAVRQQPADLVMLASADELLDLVGGGQAARRIMHQHPVAGARPQFEQSIQSLAYAGRPTGAAAVRHAEGLRAQGLKEPVAGRHHHQRASQTPGVLEGCQRVQHHRLTRNEPVLLGLAGHAASPAALPGAWNQRKKSGAWTGIGKA